jgi:hypothetical protein
VRVVAHGGGGNATAPDGRLVPAVTEAPKGQVRVGAVRGIHCR